MWRLRLGLIRSDLRNKLVVCFALHIHYQLQTSTNVVPPRRVQPGGRLAPQSRVHAFVREDDGPRRRPRPKALAGKTRRQSEQPTPTRVQVPTCGLRARDHSVPPFPCVNRPPTRCASRRPHAGRHPASGRQSPARSRLCNPAMRLKIAPCTENQRSRTESNKIQLSNARSPYSN